MVSEGRGDALSVVQHVLTAAVVKRYSGSPLWATAKRAGLRRPNNFLSRTKQDRRKVALKCCGWCQHPAVLPGH
eukprot:5251997-Prymnesium_polylepis.1